MIPALRHDTQNCQSLQTLGHEFLVLTFDHDRPQEAKENEFDKAVGISQHTEEEDRLNRRTCYEDVKVAVAHVAVQLKCVLAACG